MPPTLPTPTRLSTGAAPAQILMVRLSGYESADQTSLGASHVVGATNLLGQSFVVFYSLYFRIEKDDLTGFGSRSGKDGALHRTLMLIIGRGHYRANWTSAFCKYVRSMDS